MSTVLIGCRLPNGIVLRHPDANNLTTVKLNGRNQSEIIGATFSTTEVDESFWAEWLASNMTFAPLKNKAIFVTSDEKSAKAQAKELDKSSKTGLEPLKQDSMGVKKADRD